MRLSMKSIVGIDVAKEELVIYMGGSYYSIENTSKALDKWAKKHSDLIEKVDLFAYEPTGGYEKIAAAFFEEKGLPHARLHANHVRSYAKAMGQLAKTDAIDAKMIAEFAIAKNQGRTTTQTHPELIELTSRREQLIIMKNQETNRLETISSDVVRKQIKKHVKHLETKIKETGDKIKSYINKHDDLKAKTKHLRTIPGVGEITANSIVAYLPEVYEADSKSVSMLCGLAPVSKDSGKKQGKRKIFGGRSQVRRVLYMAALTAKKHNPVIKEFFDRLKARGKIFKVAITAAMRKLLTIIHSVANREEPWANEITLR